MLLGLILPELYGLLKFLCLGLLPILLSTTLGAMQFKALVFSDKSDKWHHPNVPVAKEAFVKLSKKHFFEMTWVETTETCPM